MWALVKKYTETLEHHAPVDEATMPVKQTVALTGATGALGAHILAKLVSLPEVEKVYALVRAKDDMAARGRLADSLKQRHIDNLNEAQANKIIPLASNIDKSNLGLSAERYEEIRTSVTAVIAVSRFLFRI